MKFRSLMRCMVAVPAFSFLAVVPACAEPNVPALELTLCELVIGAAKYDGRVVSVHAVVESDGIERTGLTDDHCPKVGVALAILDKSTTRSDVHELVVAIFGGDRVGTADKLIVATLSGIFHHHPNKFPSRVLDLQAVQNLSISPKSSD